MPPPRRPFTTSSLTNSIKSTIANSQPLLSNLTNIDKLSSQASNLAQKAPFFGAINQQFQQHSSSDQQHQHPAASNNITSTGFGSAVGNNSSNLGGATDQTMIGAGQQSRVAATGGAPPAVDMSHLTEEERLMIKSVMAKAEMADMGIPVDTSVPSSTNLPSQVSQALSQQTKQQQQQQLARQQQQNYIQQQQQQQQRQVMMNQQQQQPQAQQNYQLNSQQQPQLNQMSSISSNNNINSFDQTSNRSQVMPSLEQQTQQLVSQINSQFNLGGNSNSNNIAGNQQSNTFNIPSTMSNNAQQQQQQQQPQFQQQQPQQAQHLNSFQQQQQQQPSKQLQPNNQNQPLGPLQTSQQYDYNQQLGNTLGQQQNQLAANNMSSLVSKNSAQPATMINPQQQQQFDQFNHPANQPATSIEQQLQMQQMNGQLGPGNLDNFNMMSNLNPQQQQQQQAMIIQQQQQQDASNQFVNYQQQQPFTPITSNSNNYQQDARFGGGVSAAANVTDYNNQRSFDVYDRATLSDQENFNGASGQQDNSLALAHLRHQQFVSGGGSRSMTAAGQQQDNSRLPRQPFEADDQTNGRYRGQQNRDLQAYDLAGQQQQQRRSSPLASTTDRRYKGTRQLPQPGPAGVVAANLRKQAVAERSLGSSMEQLHQIDDDYLHQQRIRQQQHQLAKQSIKKAGQSSQQSLAGRQSKSPVVGKTGVVKKEQPQPQRRTTSKPVAVSAAETKRRRQQPQSQHKRPQVPLSSSEVYISESDEIDFGEEDVDDDDVGDENEEEEADQEEETTETMGGEDGKLVSGENGSRRSKNRQRTQTLASTSSSRTKATDSTSTTHREDDAEEDDEMRAAKLLLMEKNDRAMKLLSEFKLSEQANQVMEQQQLLIKQSQELIKLQQAQLEQQHTTKKSSSSSQAEKADGGEENDTNELTRVDREPDGNSAMGDDANMQSSNNIDNNETTSSQQLKRQDDSELKPNRTTDDDKRERGTTRFEKHQQHQSSASKKSTSFNPDKDHPNDPDESTQQQHRQNRSQQLNKLSRSVDHNDHDETSSVKSKKVPATTSKHSTPKTNTTETQTTSQHQVAQPLPRYNRDLLQSPTDTTDSDVDLVSQSTSIIQQQHQQRNRSRQTGTISSSTTPKPTRVGGAPLRRREPTGLPPSPLPVAAAIQLHQLQQQHHSLKNRSNSFNNNNANQRAGYLRSRSVTNSPNHHLLFSQATSESVRGIAGDHHHQSGYLTDGQHNLISRFGGHRPSSPDTLSEYGGQRRRKRLPEPPQNAVPLTPSMVRKMIQAQKAASLNSQSSSKLLTSVNVQSTQLTNAHSNRMPSLDRPLQASEGSSQQSASQLASNSGLPYSRQTGIAASSHHQLTTSLNSGRVVAPTLQNNSNKTTAANNSESLNKFLTSTYGNSILRNPSSFAANITEVKETPELDKLIDLNLNEYYGLDAARRRQQQQQQQNFRPALRQQQLGSESRFLAAAGLSPTRYSSATTSQAASSTRNYRPLVGLDRQPLTSAINANGGAASYRRNSEGEYSSSLRMLQQQPNNLFGSTQPKSVATSAGVGYPSSGQSTALASDQLDLLRSQNHRLSQLNNGRYSYQRTAIGQSYSPIATITSMDATNPRSLLSSSSDQYRPTTYSSESYLQRAHNLPPRTTSLVEGSLAPSLSMGKPNYNHQHQSLQGPNQLNSSELLASNWPSSTGLPYGSSASSRYLAATSAHQPFENSSPRLGSSARQPYGLSRVNFAEHGRFHSVDSRSQALGGDRLPYRHGIDLDERVMNSNPYDQQQQPLQQFDHQVNRNSYLYPSTDPTRTGANHSMAARYSSPSHGHHQLLGNSTQLGGGGSQQYQQQHEFANSSTGQMTPNPGSGFAPFTKDDIIRNGPKFNSIGYRFRTENQNKYVAEARTPADCLQTKYPHPYKRILLSKNPKDRIGNGIGVRITGGQPMPNVYDKVNKCIITSGAFVTQVFQNGNVYLMNELHEGDQIIEWNGVNLCNRSDEEVQQILLSQFSDDEVEIVYLIRDKFNEVYNLESNNGGHPRDDLYQNHQRHHHHHQQQQQQPQASQETMDPNDPFDVFSRLHKSGQNYQQGGGRYQTETPTSKGSLRRRISLSSFSHMWSR